MLGAMVQWRLEIFVRVVQGVSSTDVIFEMACTDRNNGF